MTAMSSNKKTLCIITGGKSPEHEVAIVSARNILKAIDTHLFEAIVVGIDKKGVWYLLPNEDLDIEKLQIGASDKHIPLVLQPFSEQPFLYKKDVAIGFKPDVIFPITHGVLGEDGCLQGVLEHLNIPYIGPGVLGSAIGMDKDITKKIVSLAGVKISPSHTYYHVDNVNYTAVIKDLGLPVFVKPANMGSGVGVIKANTEIELQAAIKEAFLYDDKILIEKAMTGREVETAVLGNRNPKGTRVGEIIVSSGYYTYENKYENDSVKVEIPAQNITEASMQRIQEIAIKAYKALQLEGLARVDFFYEDDNNIYLNEVNTLPGFTNISMYPKLWQDMGVNFTTLITQLVECAMERYALRNGFKKER